jgi:murein DD-endopeptidase MepM/ murein hydrolase activator NlpD
MHTTTRTSLAAHPPPPRTPLVVLAVVVLAVILGLGQGTAAGSPGPGTWHLASAVAVAQRFGWPLAPPHPVLRPFQPPRTPYGPGHRGVDLGGQANEPVLAAGDGLVLYAGPLADRSLVSIEHPGGLRTTYEPVQPSVRVGDHVRRGQVIGELMAGHPGCPATAPMVCLHWGAHRQRVYLDPLRLVEPGRIKLLPWLDGAS